MSFDPADLHLSVMECAKCRKSLKALIFCAKCDEALQNFLKSTLQKQL